MGRESIDIGTAANDGTGDPLRTAFEKTDNNFIDLYSLGGWANYADAATTPATQTFNTTPSKLEIDGGGATSESGYLPREIRGTGELWDTTNDKITPINIGDAYELRVALSVDSKTGSPNIVSVQLDIGGAASPTIVIAEIDRAAGKSAPFSLTFSAPIFSLNTFLTNGGQLFVTTDTGSITVSNRSVLLVRSYKGSL